MDIETRRRIRAYKKALPELRERVIAVALLLAMSASMLTSASFAWLTISRRPEVTGVSTTVAANGNLEIALATSDTAPGESKVGDSSAAEGQSVTSANITWGNLVNLSDPSYGLDNLTLRPAQLNEYALLTSPLYGAAFTNDGRVEKLTSSFSYTSWVPPEGNAEGRFRLTEDLGVRAVSSTKRQVAGLYGNLLDMKALAETSNVMASNIFVGITKNDEWMQLLASLMGIHMTANMNSEDKYKNHEVSAEELQGLIDMYGEFIGAFEEEAKAMANLLNVQLYAAHGGATDNYSPYNGEAVLALQPNSGRDYVIAVDGTDKDGNPKQVKITDLKTFLDDYKMLVADKAEMEKINASGDRRWTASGLRTLVNKLVNIDKCLIQFPGEAQKTVGSFVSEMSANPMGAMGYLGKSCTATITNGILYNLDQRVGAGIRVPAATSDLRNLPINAKMYVSSLSREVEATVYATIYTSAEMPSTFANDLARTDKLFTGENADAGEVVAEDTYALAVDIWVRTNADDSYLTLEGNVLTNETEVDAMGKDSNGNDVQLYSLTRVEEIVQETESAEGETTASPEKITVNYTLYKTVTEENGSETETWYNADTFAPFTLEDGETPVQKKEILVTVIGFEGENRVWNDTNDMLSTDATTQGSGSCYVYYADTPEDQARSLELLKAMNVAFIDAAGNLRAKAKMDTERSYEESGRVIVPLVLSNESLEIGNEEQSVRAIMPLVKNEPTRLTALVFLDGTVLGNENVLSAADIQGQLNIQFGSSSQLQPIENESLANQIRTASASVSVSEFDYDTHEGDMTTQVTVKVDGDQPNTITAFFLRKISETQGSREATMTFTRDESTGDWVSDYTFIAPGSYILRTVTLDGQEYVLKDTPTVEITGFNVESLTCSQEGANGAINIMTADNSYTVDLALKFASNDQERMPKSVQGRFLRDDGTAVNVNFVYNANAGTWNGSATFLTSGEYTMQFLVLDGEYAELPTGMWKKATVYLGMRVAVYTDGNTNFVYKPAELKDNEKILPMQVKIMDNSGEPMIGLTGAKLTYAPNSGTKRMDTNLTWDAASGYYYGELKTLESGGPGIWRFNNVTVSGDIITNATTSPVFTIQSAEPPEYVGLQNTTNYQFAPNGEAIMEAVIKHSVTAQVQAVIADASGKEYEVMGVELTTSGDDTTWKFQIPTGTVNSGKQDGYWTMKEIRIWDYWDKDGNHINAELDENGKLTAEDLDKIMVIDVTGENYTKKVVQTVKINFPEGQSKTFGVDENGNVTAQFLDTHFISGVHVNITDFEGQALRDVTNMTLVYDYDGKAQDNGGYTSSAAAAKTEFFTLNMATDAEGITFTQSAAQSVQYAGSYTPASFKFAVSGTQFTYSMANKNMPANVPSFAVKSKAPTVKVSATNPAPGTVKRVYSVKKPTATAQAIQGDFFRFTDYSATVYIHTPAQGGGYDQEAAEAYAPEVTLTLSGVPSGYSSATMSFATQNADSQGSDFTFTNGTAKAAVGKAVTGTRGWFGVDKYPECYPAGKMTQNKISITYGDIVYDVKLSNTVTIDQPQSPTVLQFGNIPESYTGTKPAMVQGVGTSVTVTLPELTWTARIEEPKDGTWSAYTDVEEVTDESGNPVGKAYASKHWTSTDLCGNTNHNYEYQYYTWTRFQSSITAETDIYTQNMRITQWTINGVTYNAGQTITVSGNGILTATAVYESVGEKTFVETLTQTTTKNLYGYVKSSTSDSVNGGDPIADMVEGESTEYPTVSIANPATADAANDIPGTNMTTDSAAYKQYWP